MSWCDIINIGRDKMVSISLEQYKDYLINSYKHEYDNTEYQITKRKKILKNKYKDDYLESIVLGTYQLVNKILEISDDNYHGYINIPLEKKPDITYINLDLCGGWMSDTIIDDSDNNFYSINLLKKIFGPFFSIEPCKIELTEEVDSDDDIVIMSEIPSYYLYIQCKKEVLDNAKNYFLKSESSTKILRITK